MPGGCLGSSLTNRVLGRCGRGGGRRHARLAAGDCRPPPVFFTLQAVIALIVLGISYWNFVEQSRDATSLPTEGIPDSKEQFLEQYEEFERKDDMVSARDAPMIVPADQPESATQPTSHAVSPNTRPAAPPPSTTAVLWWLTFEQARRPLAAPPPGTPSLDSVAMGRREDGKTWRLAIGPHTLVPAARGRARVRSSGLSRSGWRPPYAMAACSCTASTSRAAWRS